MKLTTETALDDLMDRFHMKRGLKIFNPQFSKVHKFQTKHFREIELHDVYYRDDDNTLYVNGKRCLIYICNPTNNPTKCHWKDDDLPSDLPRFHMAKCATISMMQNNGRGHRYVATDNKTGLFLIKYNDITSEEKLIACSHCVQKLYKGRECRDNITPSKYFKDFSSDEFCEDLFPLFSEKKDNTKYPPEWTEVSKKKKEESGGICAECKQYFPQNELHVHHIDGEKHNMNDENLKVLCIPCHRKQPFHQHMKNSFCVKKKK